MAILQVMLKVSIGICMAHLRQRQIIRISMMAGFLIQNLMKKTLVVMLDTTAVGVTATYCLVVLI